MASTKDVRDIMGFAAGGVPAAAPAKKKAPAVPKLLGGKKLTGMTREIVALHGDRPPPVAIVDTTKAYRRGFKRDVKAAHWDLEEFDNVARDDGLRLKHWRKKTTSKEGQSQQQGLEQSQTGDAMEIDGQPEPVIPAKEEKKPYEFAKFNVKVTVPTFTDEQYDKYLKDSDWTKEETEYLLELIKDCSQKWPVIFDRYEWKSAQATQPSQDSSTSATTATPSAVARPSDIHVRDLEALKARYYFICAKSMEFSLPNGVAGMNAEEFSLHELYGKFRPELERQRKAQAWILMKRPPEEIKEEEYLLAELQRIMISAQKFETERAELRNRLEHAQPILNGAAGPGAAAAAASGTLNLTSAGLTQLYNSLASQDKNRRTRPRISIDALQSPAGGLPTGLTTPASAGGHRDSISGSAAHKKGALGSATTATPQTPLRALSSRDEERFGVSTPLERITSGVSFRTDKLLKLRQAKSQIQTQKIGQALVQLDIPELLPLPTAKVVAAFERLIGKINVLLDARKMLAKEETELATAMSIKAELEKTNEPNGGETGDAEKDADGDADGDEEAEEDGEEDGEEEGEEDGEEEEDGDEDAEGEEEDDDAEGEEEEEDDDDEDTTMIDAPKVEEIPVAARPSSSRSNAAMGFKRAGSVVSTASSRGSRRKK